MFRRLVGTSIEALGACRRCVIVDVREETRTGSEMAWSSRRVPSGFIRLPGYIGSQLRFVHPEQDGFGLRCLALSLGWTVASSSIT